MLDNVIVANKAAELARKRNIPISEAVEIVRRQEQAQAPGVIKGLDEIAKHAGLSRAKLLEYIDVRSFPAKQLDSEGPYYALPSEIRRWWEEQLRGDNEKGAHDAENDE